MVEIKSVTKTDQELSAVDTAFADLEIGNRAAYVADLLAASRGISPRFKASRQTEAEDLSLDPETLAYPASDAALKRHTRTYLTQISGQRGESPAPGFYETTGFSAGNTPATDRGPGFTLMTSQPEAQSELSVAEPTASTVVLVQPKADGTSAILRHRASEPSYALSA